MEQVEETDRRTEDGSIPEKLSKARRGPSGPYPRSRRVENEGHGQAVAFWRWLAKASARSPRDVTQKSQREDAATSREERLHYNGTGGMSHLAGLVGGHQQAAGETACAVCKRPEWSLRCRPRPEPRLLSRFTSSQGSKRIRYTKGQPNS